MWSVRECGFLKLSKFRGHTMIRIYHKMFKIDFNKTLESHPTCCISQVKSSISRISIKEQTSFNHLMVNSKIINNKIIHASISFIHLWNTSSTKSKQSFFVCFVMLSVIIKNALTRISYVSIFLCIIIHLQLHNACIWWEKWTCQRSYMNKRKFIKKVLLYDDDDGGWLLDVCTVHHHSFMLKEYEKRERQKKTIECSRKKRGFDIKE